MKSESKKGKIENQGKTGSKKGKGKRKKGQKDKEKYESNERKTGRK